MVPTRPLRMDSGPDSLSRQPPCLLCYLIIAIGSSLLRSGPACLRHSARNQAQNIQHFVSILDYLSAAANHHSFEGMVGFAALDHDCSARVTTKVYYLLGFGKAGHHHVAVINSIGHRNHVWIAVAVDSRERTIIALFQPFRGLGGRHSNCFSGIRLFHSFHQSSDDSTGLAGARIRSWRSEPAMERFLQIV